MVRLSRSSVGSFVSQQRRFMALDRKYGKVSADALTLEGDEPVFIIRAKDKTSIQALLQYATSAHAAGSSVEFVRDVIASAVRFDDWQKKYPDVVKIPD